MHVCFIVLNKLDRNLLFFILLDVVSVLIRNDVRKDKAYSLPLFYCQFEFDRCILLNNLMCICIIHKVNANYISTIDVCMYVFLYMKVWPYWQVRCVCAVPINLNFVAKVCSKNHSSRKWTLLFIKCWYGVTAICKVRGNNGVPMINVGKWYSSWTATAYFIGAIIVPSICIRLLKLDFYIGERIIVHSRVKVNLYSFILLDMWTYVRNSTTISIGIFTIQ